MTLPALPKQPLVSILIASYNYDVYIEEAVRSAQQQTYGNIEIIVCDDGSTDGSCAVVERHCVTDNRIQLFQQENSGVAVALNHAFEHCRGDIICLLDADDRFDAGKVEKVVGKMRVGTQTGYVQHAMTVIDHKGREMRQLPAHGLFEEGWIAETLLKRGGRWRNMPASALSFRREVAEVLFPLPAEHLRSMADAYLYMLAPLLTEIGYIPDPLSDYRLHGTNLTGSLQFDLNVSSKYVEGIQRVHQSIEQTIAQRALQVPALNHAQHLTYQEHRYLQALFEGKSRRKLYKMYGQLSRMIKRDDLYPMSRKWLGRFVLGIALLIPLEQRARWITRALRK